MQAMLMARVLIRNTVDTYLDWYLGTKLDMLMNEHRVVRIIHLLHGTYHLYCSCTVSCTLLYTPCSEKSDIFIFFHISHSFLTNFMKLSNSGVNVLQPVFLHEADT